MKSLGAIEWGRRLRHGLAGHASAALDSFRGLVLPPICSFCEIDLTRVAEGPDGDRPTAAASRLCAECRAILAQEPLHRCPRCAAAVAPTFRGADCPWCRKHDVRFDRTFTLGTYRDELRDAILRLKHRGHEALSTALTEMAWERNADAVRAAGIDVVVPIPMHWWRRARQGHNGPDLAASFWARRLQLNDYPRLLVRRRRTKPQAGLTHPERWTNVRNAFSVRRGYRVDGASVMLVDDILTTGATCSEAARTLKKAGAKSITVVVTGRAQGET